MLTIKHLNASIITKTISIILTCTIILVCVETFSYEIIMCFCICIFVVIACCSERLFRKCQNIYNPQPDCEPLLSTDKSVKSKCDDKKHGKGQFETKNKQDLASEEFKKKQIKMLSNQPRRSTGLTDMNSRFVTFDFLIRGFALFTRMDEFNNILHNSNIFDEK